MTTATIEKRVKDPAELQAMLDAVDDLPTIPDVLFRILKVLDDPGSGASDLAEVVRLDAPLTARILRLANSPYYCGRGDLTDIHRCIAVLGYRTVRQVAICVTVATSVINAAANAGGRLDYRDLWRHSVVTAAIAKRLAEISGHPEPEEVFTAGLLHDLGKFLLEIHAPEAYWRVIRNARRGDETLCEAEHRSFGFDHAVLGEAFGMSWNFPRVFQRCCGHHHDAPGASDPGSTEGRTLALVAVGDYLANTMDPPRTDLGFDPAAIDVVGLHRAAGLRVEDVEGYLPDLQETVEKSLVFVDLDPLPA
jgi:putative nucleotidyltransferase with HDIG domain